MKPTIKDVANKSGVGLSTVSRVINDNYPVSDDVRNRVNAAIDELGYSPNAIARSLKSRKTQLIGVVVDDISNQFYMQLVKGIEDVVKSKNYSIIISSSGGNPDRENTIINRFIDNCVDGLIVATCQTDDSAFDRARKCRVPLVMVDRHVPHSRFDAVVEDNEANSFELINHLISCGHRRICVVNGVKGVSTVDTRYMGYHRAMTENGIEIDPRLVVYRDSGEEIGTILRSLFNSLPKENMPTAIFATNNLRCETVIEVLLEMGLRVPDDISLVSYGDIYKPWMFYSRLTHITQDMSRLGKKTAELMLEKLLGQGSSNAREYIISSEIVYGDSVKNLSEVMS